MYPDGERGRGERGGGEALPARPAALGGGRVCRVSAGAEGRPGLGSSGQTISHLVLQVYRSVVSITQKYFKYM